MSEVVIEGFVDTAPVVTGTASLVIGFTSGSSVITCDGIDEKRVFVIRGLAMLNGLPGGGFDFYNKNIADNLLTLSNPLTSSEYIYIRTISV